MTRSEAGKRCTDLRAAGEPDVHWMARQSATGEWTVVRLRLPGLPIKGPLSTAQESGPRPGAPDPRPLVNPYWAAG